MASYVFIGIFILALIGVAVAFLPHIKEQRKRIISIGAVLSLLPILLKISFLLYPQFEAHVMPIELYAPIQREFWLPFAVLFFALTSHLVPNQHRRGILFLVGVVFVAAIQQSFWHLSKPEQYEYKGEVFDGVCQQTSFETCGAASMVTLLNAIGINTTEGEMARLSMTAPGQGLTPHLAAYGLQQKLTELKRSNNVAVMACELNELYKIATPFLAGIRFSSVTNHMVCILDKNQDYLVVGDPIGVGRKKWSWVQFEKIWSGIIVICH